MLGDKWISLTLLLHNVNGMPNGSVIFMEDQKVEYIWRSFAYGSFSKFKNQSRDHKQK